MKRCVSTRARTVSRSFVRSPARCSWRGRRRAVIVGSGSLGARARRRRRPRARLPALAARRVALGPHAARADDGEALRRLRARAEARRGPASARPGACSSRESPAASSATAPSSRATSRCRTCLAGRPRAQAARLAAAGPFRGAYDRSGMTVVVDTRRDFTLENFRRVALGAKAFGSGRGRWSAWSRRATCSWRSWTPIAPPSSTGRRRGRESR